jgi:hypothetical protein
MPNVLDSTRESPVNHFMHAPAALRTYKSRRSLLPTLLLLLLLLLKLLLKGRLGQRYRNAQAPSRRVRILVVVGSCCCCCCCCFCCCRRRRRRRTR